MGDWTLPDVVGLMDFLKEQSSRYNSARGKNTARNSHLPLRQLENFQLPSINGPLWRSTHRCFWSSRPPASSPWGEPLQDMLPGPMLRLCTVWGQESGSS